MGILTQSSIKLIKQCDNSCYVDKLCTAYKLISTQSRIYTPVSPQTILTGLKFDYNKDCQKYFGQYAQVHQNNTSINNQDSWTTEDISLVPTVNLQGR